jgi:hypothetical protein
MFDHGFQDDKGLLAIAVMGMPPFSPHDNDPLRAVLAALEMRDTLKVLLTHFIYQFPHSGKIHEGEVPGGSALDID